MARQLLPANVPWEDHPSSRKPLPQELPAHDQNRLASPPSYSQLQSAARLQKNPPRTAHSRAASAQYPTGEPTLPNLQQLQQGYANNNNLGADLNLLPPPPIHSATHSRSSSLERPVTPSSFYQSSRPSTPSFYSPAHSVTLSDSPNGATTEKLKKKDKRGQHSDNGASNPKAWVLRGAERVPFDVDSLMAGRAQPEFWDDEDGNCEVYLFPESTGKGPSFKIDSDVFASSPILTRLAFGDVSSGAPDHASGRRHASLDLRVAALTLNAPATPPLTPRRSVGNFAPASSRSSNDTTYDAQSKPQRCRLFVPIQWNASQTAAPPTPKKNSAPVASDHSQTAIDYRNFFAFLCGSSLVATEKRNSFFTIFMTIAGILRQFEFTNMDGSTYGEVANESFNHYVRELRLADVRSSRESTMDGIILAERMRSVLLYNECFTHGVGKYHDLVASKNPKFSIISAITQNRLARASLDLDKRVASVRLTLTDFDFPFLFSGIMNSKVSEERKEGVRFAAWKDSFMGMRKFVTGLYKVKYGSWPPKASSKKNTLETSGLNRVVLQETYQDFSALYDLLADRTNLTTRTIDGIDRDDSRDSAKVRGLRHVLSEYDRSSPPVKPAVPFDLPLLPNLRTTRPNDFGHDPHKDQKAASKKLKDDEIAALLRASHNSDVRPSPFLSAFLDMEARAAHGCTLAELEALRIGQWIFMYVVIQALPMLACDAPGLHWTQNVEYFLCEPPRSGVPWAANPGQSARTWFSVASATSNAHTAPGDHPVGSSPAAGTAGTNVVSLPADLVEHGVEGIYHRSHCWVVAQRWSRADPVLAAALHSQQTGASPLPPPPQHPAVAPAPSAGASLSSRGSSPHYLSAPGGSRGGSPSSAAQHHKRLSSLGYGLEALPLPAGVAPETAAGSSRRGDGERGRPRSMVPAPAGSGSGQGQGQGQGQGPATTFDAILAGVETGKKGKKK